MGRTPRQRLTQIPMPTRSTEAGTECFGRIALSYLREDEQADASFFVLGDLLHQAIEFAIENDADPERMENSWLDEQLHGPNGIVEMVSVGMNPQIESTQRGWDSLVDDYVRMINNWFNHTHPDSDKRHPIYDDYEWPPRTEVPFRRDVGTKYPIWGSVDAVFIKPGYLPNRTHQNYMITDWKSGVKRPDSDFQLNFYRYGLDLPDVPAHYHMLDRVQKRSIVVEADPYPGDAEILDAINLTERRKEAIVKGYYPKFRPGWYCGYCPVQHICPADGDPRLRGGHRTELEKLLRKTEKMEEIPEEVLT